MKTDPKTFLFADDGKIPNHPTLPLLYYRQVLLPEQRSPDACRELFRSCNWRNSWVNGVYNFHHYHSITHEVLGVTGGQATLILGGEAGEKVQVSAGDVIVIPAGVGHFNQDSSADFQVVGAYPNGMDWDLCYGKAEERPIKMDNIQRVPLPDQDPVYGDRGPLTDLWK